MMKHPILAAGLAAMLGIMANAAQAQNNKPTKADEKFMTQAIQGDMAEVQMGKLAEQNGSSEQVKQFGQKLVSDHSSNLDKAKSVAQSLGMTAPTSPSAKQKADYKKMSKLSGAKFDRQFAKAMVEDHKKDISKFEKESKKSGPAASFASETLPTLKEHLQMAQSLNGAATTGSRH